MNDAGAGPGNDAGERTSLAALAVCVARLPPDGMRLTFRADAEERARLAARFDIPAVERFEAELMVERWRGDGAMLAGRFSADIVQTCVLTLVPVRQRVEEAVDLAFVPEGPPPRPSDPEPAVLPADIDEDEPETFVNGRIDLGEVLADLLALALDPYPRAGDVVFAGVDTDPDPAGGRLSPFANLQKLKSRPD